jgi:hypothetical protein
MVTRAERAAAREYRDASAKAFPPRATRAVRRREELIEALRAYRPGEWERALSERLAEGMPPMRVGELARILGYSSSFLYKLIRKGILKGCTRRGWEWRIPLRVARRLIRRFYRDEAVRPTLIKRQGSPLQRQR